MKLVQVFRRATPNNRESRHIAPNSTKSRHSTISRRLSVPLTALMLLGCGHAWAQAPQRLIVKWASATASVPAGQIGSASRIMSDTQANFGVTMRPMRTLVTGGQVVQLTKQMPPADLRKLMAMLAQNPAVEYVHEDVRLRLAQTAQSFVPNDPLYNQQFHLVDGSGTSRVEKFREAWSSKSGQGIRVAVVDSGITEHPDLAANLLPGYDFISDPFVANDGDGRDPNPLDPGDFTEAGACGPGHLPTNSTWHGTHVAGLIAAVSGNSLGVVGVARNAKVVPVRAIGRCWANLSDVAEAVIWAAGGPISGVPTNPYPAQIINLSLSGPGTCNATSQRVIDIARGLGAIIVVAAGNKGANIRDFIPASCNGVIVVGAVDRFGMNTSYTNFGTDPNFNGFEGPFVHIMAMGSGVLSTTNSGASTPVAASYQLKTGTSMATAIVSGVVALMIENRPGNDWYRIQGFLRASGTPNCQGFCGPRIVTGAAATALPLDTTQPVPIVYDVPPCTPLSPCNF